MTFIDDSKATNVGAVVAALDGFGTGDRSIVLIAGGDAKGASFGSPQARGDTPRFAPGGDRPRCPGGRTRASRTARPVLRAGSMRHAVQLAA